jgi:hypothetical protein
MKDLKEPTPEQIWQNFHWAFFINTQGLIVCLQRFEIYLLETNLLQAQVELETATTLMMASGAAMELAGSFSRQAYDQAVRPTMMPPHVQSHDFSGLMSWEHAVLVQLWKSLRPIFATMPTTLHPSYQAFTNAYLSLAKSHRAVCQKFGGAEVGSLRFEQGHAVDAIDAFIRSRYQLINPGGNLPIEAIPEPENENSS